MKTEDIARNVTEEMGFHYGDWNDILADCKQVRRGGDSMNRKSDGMSTGMAILCTIGVLPPARAIRLQIVRRHILPAAVLQRRVIVRQVLMMMVIMRFMKMMITTGTVTGAMMIMFPVWMMQWKMKTGKSGGGISVKKSIWRQCKRKKRYRDQHTANYYRKKFEQARGQKLDYYWCPYCNGYHLTSSGFIWVDFDIEEALEIPAIAVG